jgi:hypothetical protein
MHGGGFGPHPRTEAKGLSDGVSDLLRRDAVAPRCAEPQRSIRVEREAVEPHTFRPSKRYSLSTRTAKPWSRIEQALRVTDLLLQAGGFSAIVLGLGSIAPEHVSRIPLATWFRYGAAAERSRTSVLLLTQHACSKSSAGLVLRLQTASPFSGESTVLAGLERPVEVSRQRFTVVSANVVPDPRAISTSFVERQNLTMRMSMRRFTRLTNGFSKKLQNHEAAIALHFMHYNFCRVHKTLRVTPAMEAGLAHHVWTVEELVSLIPVEEPKKRGPYKKRT